MRLFSYYFAKKLLSKPRILINPCFFSFAANKDPVSPKEILIPKEKILSKFCRSSGPGGQNVNKVNTKVEIRFHVDSADWIKEEVKKKLKEFHKNSINSEGELIITCQIGRTQERNLSEAYEKLRMMIFECSFTEKDREFLIPAETEGLERRRIQSKRKKSDIKKTRSGNGDFR